MVSIDMKLHSVVLALFASFAIIGCGHHKHHREDGEKQRRHSEEKREHKRDRESLTGKVIRYPFRMTGYAIAAPFHPFKATRKAVDATLDVPEKALTSTAEALFGRGSEHDRKRRPHSDREEEHEEREHDEEEEKESEPEDGEEEK